MLLNIILFVLGFILLIAGANFLIIGASDLGKKYKIPSIVIGMVVVGFGTSLPELIISMVASSKGSSDISISNVVGSNIANILLILGIVLSITNVKISSSILKIKIPFIILSSFILLYITNDVIFRSAERNFINRSEGIGFLVIFGLFLFYSFFLNKDFELSEIKDGKTPKLLKIIILISLGIIGVYVGGDWVVENSLEIARYLGISEAFIGVSILAIGSSLPEVISSVTAILKKESGLAIGNIIGSNIFNTFLVLGIAALIRPLSVSGEQQFNIIFNIVVSVLFLVVAIRLNQNKKSKPYGIALIALFIGFIIFSYFNPF